MRKTSLINSFAVACSLALGALSLPAAAAETGSVVGNWYGTGIVHPSGYAPERARCKALIRKAPARGAYDATISCNTSQGVLTQSARMTRTGRNSFRGSFYNAQYDVRGTVSATIRGKQQNVRMISNKATGTITLHR